MAEIIAFESLLLHEDRIPQELIDRIEKLYPCESEGVYMMTYPEDDTVVAFCIGGYQLDVISLTRDTLKAAVWKGKDFQEEVLITY